jgi:7-cyano-7-deazaguanine synthase
MPGAKPERGRGTPPSESVVALISGGIDSGVMIARSLRQGCAVHPLYVRQGALWEDAEEAGLNAFLNSLDPSAGRLAPLEVLRLDWPSGFLHHWAVDGAAPPPDAHSPDETVYLPGRNLALLTQAALLGQSVGASVLRIGLLAQNPFADSQPDFFQAFERAFALATLFAVRVEAPLSDLSKEQVIREAAALGLPLEHTFSCLRPLNGRHCGRCNKCAERQRGFARAGVPDPTAYDD